MSSRSTPHLNIVSLFEEGFIAFKKSWYQSGFMGFIVMLPLALLMWSPLIGSVVILTLQGPLLLLFVEMVHTKQFPRFWRSRQKCISLFENGFLLTVILFPLLAISLLLFVIPAVVIISLFIFSASLITMKDCFAIDALMASLKMGEKHRLALVFLSFVMLLSFVIIFIFTESIPILFAIVGGLLLSYEMTVVVAVYNRLTQLGNSDEQK